MKNDFDLIVKKFGVENTHINIYPLGDLHIGSDQLDGELWKRWKNKVMSDPQGYIVINGDIFDNATKNSKTNIYEATLRPRNAKDWLVQELEPLKDKILAVCRGNHEARSVDLTDSCPLYDAMAKLDLEHLYRENMAFLKVNLGFKNKERQWSYVMAVAHGKSKGKNEKFSYMIDGMDVFVTAHTHTPLSRFPSKIVVDSKNETVGLKGFVHISVPSFARFGGYTLRDMYDPQDSDKFPMITLSGVQKGVKVTWM